MTGRLLLLGMIAGLVAGILAFGTARIWGEPPVAAAIALETARETGGGNAVPDLAAQGHGADHDHGHGDDHDHAGPWGAGDHAAPAGQGAAQGHAGAHAHSHGAGEGISRAAQAGIGLLTGMAVYGAALGGLLALVFAAVQGRAWRLEPRASAGLIALAGFIAAVLIPQLKYPANPPAVGHAETIGLRTALFFLMLAISVAAMVLAVTVGAARARRGGDPWRGALTGAAVYGAVVLAAGLLLPRINEVPADFPGDLLWRFRMAALAVQAVLWGAAGLIFGWLAARMGRPLAQAAA